MRVSIILRISNCCSYYLIIGSCKIHIREKYIATGEIELIIADAECIIILWLQIRIALYRVARVRIISYRL